MRKIVAMGASNSTKSINKELATYTANQVDNAEVEVIDLNEYEMPIYGIDREREQGIPQKAIEFKSKLENSDGIVISFAEHNGAYSAAFKNIMDWISRINKDTWANKPMFLLATSPGSRGGATVLDIAVNKFKFMNSNAIQSFSLPFFGKYFDHNNGINEPGLKEDFEKQLNQFELSL